MNFFPIKSNEYSSTRELSKSNQTKLNYTYFISRREEIVPEKALLQKQNLPQRISSVNMTKSAVFCRFGHIYRANPLWKNFVFSTM